MQGFMYLPFWVEVHSSFFYPLLFWIFYFQILNKYIYVIKKNAWNQVIVQTSY